MWVVCAPLQICNFAGVVHRPSGRISATARQYSSIGAAGALHDPAGKTSATREDDDDLDDKPTTWRRPIQLRYRPSSAAHFQATAKMSMFRAKKFDLGCSTNIKVIRDHSKRKAFEAHEAERY